jgi:CBS domain-containing protein
MSANPTTIALDTPIPRGLRVMRQSLGKRLPVLDDEGRAAGANSGKDLRLDIRETEQNEDINGRS